MCVINYVQIGAPLFLSAACLLFFFVLLFFFRYILCFSFSVFYMWCNYHSCSFGRFFFFFFSFMFLSFCFLYISLCHIFFLMSVCLYVSINLSIIFLSIYLSIYLSILFTLTYSLYRHFVIVIHSLAFPFTFLQHLQSSALSHLTWPAFSQVTLVFNVKYLNDTDGGNWNDCDIWDCVYLCSFRRQVLK